MDLIENLTRKYGSVTQARQWIDSAVWGVEHGMRPESTIANLQRAIKRLEWAIEDVKEAGL